jgi:hypothetical protein
VQQRFPNDAKCSPNNAEDGAGGNAGLCTSTGDGWEYIGNILDESTLLLFEIILHPLEFTLLPLIFTLLLL